MTDHEAKQFGRFTTRAILGKGAMGVVYLADDSEADEQVALKVIHIDPGVPDAQRTELKRRFEVEARTAGAIKHDNLVAIRDSGEEGPALYIAMEYVAGESLDRVLESGRVLELTDIADIATKVAAGLDAAHEQQIVHRDVKPGNVVISNDGAVKITDFGVAREATSTLTRAGTMIGTPAYMSPEQIRELGVTGAADQFSLAAVLYRLLTGKLPFSGASAVEVMGNVVKQEPEPPSGLNVRLGKEVDGVLLRGLAKDPADRYASCSELAASLRQALGLEPSQAAAAEPASAIAAADATMLFNKGPIDLSKPSGAGGGSADATARIQQPVAGRQTARGLSGRTIGMITLALLAIALLMWAALS